MSRSRIVALLICLAVSSSAAAAAALDIVVWAPGYPGSTEQAQPTMDAFGQALAGAAGAPLPPRVTYYKSLEEGRAAVEGSARLVMVPTAVWAAFGKELSLTPLVQVQRGDSGERWSLVAARGKVSEAGDLAGMTLSSQIGYAPEFVRGPVLSAWGALPDSTTVAFESRIRSALRRASKGEPEAVLIDSEQRAALGSLRFAAELEVVATSPSLPLTLVCIVGDPSDSALPVGVQSLRQALLEMHHTNPEVLESLRVDRFVPVDADALEALRR
ncbi:hypothetical protein ABI59_08585 [Acidobacteria bacterium Mor1]|nr:hypothetical protein ABI59_08585 [Acidobacteria bacterium Mor1]